MKRVMLFSIMIAAMAFCFAQTQKGVVKTRGRMVAGKLVPGTLLQGATVQVEGRQAILAKDGKFSFPVTDGKFVIKSVTKQGYSLVDAEVCRQYSYSPTPLQIVMEVPGQQLSDQLAKERALRRELERRMQQREDEIDAMNISFDEKNRLLLQVAKEREANENIIKEMAQYYSTLDYDQLDAFQQKVSECLERGDMERADSLLQSRGSIGKRISQVIDRKTAQAKEEESLKQRQKILDESRKGLQKEIEVVAADCYNYYQRYLLSHQNDSAAHYLIVRSALDTDNVDWLREAASFIELYLGDYNKALDYYRSMLKKAERMHGKVHPTVADAYTGIGRQYLQMGQTDSVWSNFNEALSIRTKCYGLDHPMVANSLVNMGGYNLYKKMYGHALGDYSRAQAMYREAWGENNARVADCYNSIGACLMKLGDSKAMDYFSKALAIDTALYGTDHPDVAVVYMNMATLYAEVLGDNAKAAEYYQKSFGIEKQIFGDKHPRVARVLENMAINANLMENYDKSLEYSRKAVAINSRIYGENGFELAQSYYNMGLTYLYLNNLDESAKYIEKSIDITTTAEGDDYEILHVMHTALGFVYHSKEQYSDAIECFQRAMLVQKQWFGDYDLSVAGTHENMAETFLEMGDLDKATEHYEKAMDILSQNDEGNSETAAEIQESLENIKTEIDKKTKQTKNNKKAPRK